MSRNSDLQAAARAKKDEFYTQLADIEKELRHYRKHFKDKTVFCNCDDPFESNFFRYFVLNFNKLGLKKLIATCYTGSSIANQQLSLYDVPGASRSARNGGKPYVAQLEEYRKKFIIIGNANAITYKEFFPLLMNNRVWIGPSIHSGDRKFNVPDDYPLEAAGCGIDENGQKYIKVKGVRWFTNLDFKQRHERLAPECDLLVQDKKGGWH